MRHSIIRALAFTATLQAAATAAEPAKQATLYKTPNCGCCETHAEYLEDNGYAMTVKPTHDLPLLRRQHGVPEDLEGCHMILVDGYVVEGHVSAAALDRLLAERPAIKGISVPGMPTGSPGMSGPKTGPLVTYEIGDGPPRVFMVE